MPGGKQNIYAGSRKSVTLVRSSLSSCRESGTFSGMRQARIENNLINIPSKVDLSLAKRNARVARSPSASLVKRGNGGKEGIGLPHAPGESCRGLPGQLLGPGVPSSMRWVAPRAAPAKGGSVAQLSANGEGAEAVIRM